MSDYVIAIPSYRRAELCNNKTLTMLHDNKIMPAKITVYVADKEEHELYKKVLNPAYYGALIVGRLGLAQQRQFISEQYPVGKRIVFLDDDVETVDLSLSAGLFKGALLSDFFKTAFGMTQELKAFIWGVYPVNNPYFIKSRPEISTNLNYIVGAFYGIINRHDKDLELTITATNGQKEDVERTIRYFKKDGIVVRFNKVSFKTKYYGKSGGLGTFEERLEPMRVAAEALEAAYPEYGKVVMRRNGMTEFRLKKNVKGVVPPPQNERTDTSRSYIKIRDKKLYTDLQNKLLIELDKISIPKLTGNNRVEILGTIGRSMTFGYGYKIAASPGAYRWNKIYPAVWEALVAFGNALVPEGWEYDSITLNKDMIANKHKDKKNVGLSVIVGIGDYTGGELRVWNAEDSNPKEYNIHNKPLMFNGGLLYHEGTPFQKERYTMVFYKQGYKAKKDTLLIGK